MAAEYCVDTVKALQDHLGQLGLHRPIRIGRYEPGQQLTYAVQPVSLTAQATVRMTVDRFVGGGFAGQVHLRDADHDPGFADECLEGVEKEVHVAEGVGAGVAQQQHQPDAAAGQDVPHEVEALLARGAVEPIHFARV